MYPAEFARPVKQNVLAQAKGYAYVGKQLLLFGACNAFLWRSFCLEAFGSFYAYGPSCHISSGSRTTPPEDNSPGNDSHLKTPENSSLHCSLANLRCMHVTEVVKYIVLYNT